MGDGKRRRAQDGQEPSAVRIRPFAAPVQRAAEFLCLEVHLELRALAGEHPDDYLADRGGSIPSSEDERLARQGALLIAGEALGKAAAEGAFDDPVSGAALLAEHAQRLGDRYVAMLAMLDEPSSGGSADGTETAEQLQLATQIDTRMRQLESAGMGRVEIVASMYDYMPSFRRLTDMLPADALNQLCCRFDGFWRFAKLLESIALDIKDGRLHVPR
ncbi:hypothetical protein SAMN05519103_08618 [Rhizobiales bacterium GAS113]|nr:hypothetical protein SAMN05519103_08618 [Rhizobiales bacterium GAS113]